VGQVAEVITPIPFSGLGEIALIYKGTREHHAARSVDNEPIESGCRVSIVEFLGGTATVERTAKVK
jgi:membrane-bound ClpP family serine protease